MTAEWTPMRWPAAWKSLSSFDLVRGTAVNCLILDKGGDLATVAARAAEAGFEVIDPGSQPPGIKTVKGLWPGIRLSRSGSNDATAGPTGEPWVDSNGWRVRLAQALNPSVNIWVDAMPQNARLSPEAYVIAIADSAAPGGRWIISLDDKLAAGLLDHEPQAVETWRRLNAAARFFGSRKGWADYVPEAVLGVVSDFATPQSEEVLNLVARSNQQFRIILKTALGNSAFEGLRALIYPDVEPPSPATRERILVFVRQGGLLIAGPKWGDAPGSTAASADHPRYALRTLGKGTLAIAKENLNDPYLLANDAVMLMSHRYELLRLWNSGAVSTYYSAAPSQDRGLVQIIFFARSGASSAAVRIVGPFRKAHLLTIDRNDPSAVPFELQKGAIEVHLPAVSQYAAIELAI